MPGLHSKELNNLLLCTTDLGMGIGVGVGMGREEGRGCLAAVQLSPPHPQERNGVTSVTAPEYMPQGWVSQGRAGPLLHSCSEFRGVKGLPTHPRPTVIQAWQQISWQCAGQSPLFLTHGVCGQCHVLWGSYAWVPPSWAQRALIKGED